MASQKRVLVQFGDHNRSGHVPSAYKSSKTEFELLIERVQDVYSDLLPPNCTIFPQVKDEEWGGAFVDYFEGMSREFWSWKFRSAGPKFSLEVWSATVKIGPG